MKQFKQNSMRFYIALFAAGLMLLYVTLERQTQANYSPSPARSILSASSRSGICSSPRSWGQP